MQLLQLHHAGGYFTKPYTESVNYIVFLSHREQLRAALEYVREWNTNSRLCHAAQALLAAILRRHPPQVSAAGQQCVLCASPLPLGVNMWVPQAYHPGRSA
jgi:Utp13 specific WD40 associated domain